ncbi:MAG: ABC-F family ATP-binding cassette domain-containing protein [Rickettsiaceae bacterium]|nr:ABC-F family ATP-binding cassette domain-containing protein [Rickettsiaceae bacterium]
MYPLFYLKAMNLSFADKHILTDINLHIMPGDRICLVGRNGCGKSSLMKVIIGEYAIDSGELFQDPTVQIGYLKQDMQTLGDELIYDFVLKDFEGNIEENKYKADILFTPLQINGYMKLSECSGGQLRRVYLARSLIQDPEILLLDEPTNHLDIKTIEWLEGYLSNYSGALICISHDRTFQENISNKVWWIDRGILRKSERGFKHYDQWREDIIAEEEAQLRKLGRKLEAEQGWLSTGVTARRKRNQQRLANLYRLRELHKSHQSYLNNAKQKLNIKLQEEAKKSQFIIEAENISYNFPGKTLFDAFSFRVKKGEKIGVIGPNGVGKSTFIKLLTKEIEPQTGKVRHGTNLDITYFDQHRSELNPNITLKQTLCPGGGDHVQIKDKSMHVAAYLKQFMFDPKILNDKVLTLSGGERHRLLLAKALINTGNFMVLDEPTNDLDLDSLEMLLEILAHYTGTLIVVSHDRDFLEQLVTRTLIFSEQKIVDLYGGYKDYLKYHNNQNNHIAVVAKSKKTQIDVTKPAISNKLSYKYTRLLECLPREMEQIEHEIKNIEKDLLESDLYNKDNNKFLRLTQALQDKQKLLDEKLILLLEVEEIRNSLK